MSGRYINHWSVQIQTWQSTYKSSIKKTSDLALCDEKGTCFCALLYMKKKSLLKFKIIYETFDYHLEVRV
jgi:hypothetical protein